MKTNKILKTLGITAILLYGILLTIGTVYADTDGTELQVEQPSKLEIQLDPAWAGVEFQLKTDVGLYPGTITVGADGVLRTELGGSTGYILSCLNSAVPAPTPEGDEQPASHTEQTAPPETTEDPADQDTAPPEAGDEEATVGGIPVKHIILFVGGLLLAVGCLAGITVARKHRAAGNMGKDDDDDW